MLQRRYRRKLSHAQQCAIAARAARPLIEEASKRFYLEMRTARMVGHLPLTQSTWNTCQRIARDHYPEDAHLWG